MMKSRNPEPRLQYLKVEITNYVLYYRNRVTLFLQILKITILVISIHFSRLLYNSHLLESKPQAPPYGASLR